MKERTGANTGRNCLLRAISTVLLTGVGSVLVSCAATDSQTSQGTPAPTAQTSTATARPAVPNSQVVALPELNAANGAETQRLIDEINRDGNPLAFEDYREQAPQAVDPQGDDIVELNYEQADLRQVLEDLADAIDITLIADPSIDARISIRTSPNRPLTRDDIWPLVRVITRDNGVTLERLGDFWAAYVVANPLPTDIVTPETVSQTLGNRVMQITPLTYVAPDTAIEVLTPMVDENAIIKLTNRNVLAISGSAAQLERINELLTLIDADPFSNQGIQLFQLRNASAEEVATELDEILTLIEGPAPTYQVKGISRINAILVTAPATRGFDEISRWVRILDSENQEQVEQLFYYQVKNISAVELAETLSNVFEEDDSDFVPAAPDAPEDITIDTVDTDAGSAFVVSGAVSANLRVRIVADEATNSLLIRSTARDYRQLLTTINQLDSVPLQVVVNAVIAQITLTENTRFGVDWSRVAANAAVDDISTNTSTTFLPQSSSGSGLGGLLFDKTFVDGSARVDATLEAIANNNEVQLLARPTLTVTNNQEGQIQIGSDVPVQGGSTIAVGGQQTFNIQYREIGIVLTLTPQINADGVVNLTIEQELSSLAGEGILQNPIFSSQTISTSVVVRDGESVVLGGLIQDDNQNLNTGVPGLNRIPVLGGLFSYQQDLNERRELFIVLRPEVVNLNDEATVGYTEILERFELAAELFEEAGL